MKKNLNFYVDQLLLCRQLPSNNFVSYNSTAFDLQAKHKLSDLI